jgi:HD-like signal output (HDOD) protein
VELPTLPQVVAKINALVEDPDVGVREIGAAVAEDAPIAAKVLKIANSAYFGLREKVISTEHATAVLGIRMLRTVAMQASVLRQYDHVTGGSDFDCRHLWKHAILTGQVSAALASRCKARAGAGRVPSHRPTSRCRQDPVPRRTGRVVPHLRAGSP